MLKKQGNACALCFEPFITLTGVTGPHLDHDHETMKVRGVLHSKCNAALGLMGDSPKKLQLAINYLLSHGKLV
jgi:hypothetical protein